MNVRLLVRLIALVFLASFVNLFAQSSVVTFADQNFEKTIRRYIEMDGCGSLVILVQIISLKRMI